MTRQDAWRSNNERHYCAVCNSWMGSDRMSIQLHEQGKQHRAKVDLALQQRRHDKMQQETNERLLQTSLQQMESTARQSLMTHDKEYLIATTDPFGLAPPSTTIVAYAGFPQPVSSALLVASRPIRETTTPVHDTTQKVKVKQEKNEWDSRKKRRTEEKTSSHQNDDNIDDTLQLKTAHSRHRIAPDQGHYNTTVQGGDQTMTFLEGPTFGDILEPDMPIQLWIGHPNASLAEMRLLEREQYWTNALVVAVHPGPSAEHNSLSAVAGDSQNAECTNDDDVWNRRWAVDVAYLKHPDDEDETTEQSVPLQRIRIQLGDCGDPLSRVPATLDEARLLAMGGDEEVYMTGGPGDVPVVDEATGLSGWATVQIKRTTVHQEQKEERARRRQNLLQAQQRAEQLQKELNARKMEEAKVSNADDSALGAYDVWSQTTSGYKGVDIHTEAKVDIQGTGKKLADGKSHVGFKKFVARGSRAKRRTTSADDD